MECMYIVSVCERFWWGEWEWEGASTSNVLAQPVLRSRGFLRINVVVGLHICDTARSYNTPTLQRHAITITRALSLGRWRNRARLWLLTPDRLDPQPCDRHWEPNVLGPGAAEGAQPLTYASRTSATGRVRVYLGLQNTFRSNRQYKKSRAKTLDSFSTARSYSTFHSPDFPFIQKYPTLAIYHQMYPDCSP